jgi:hypothetical protein
VPSGLDFLFSAIYHKVESKDFEGKESKSKEQKDHMQLGKMKLIPR